MERLVLRARSGVAVPERDPDVLARAITELAAWHGAEAPERLAVVQALRRDVIADDYFRLLGRLQTQGAVR